MVRSIARVLVVLLVLAPLAFEPVRADGGDCGTGADASDSVTAGTPWPGGSTCAGDLASSSDTDAFAFEAADNVLLTANLSFSSGIAFVCIRAPDGSTPACVRGGPEGPGVSVVTDQTGEWIVAVEPFSGGGPYSLSVAATAAPFANDCRQGRDASARAQRAVVIGSAPVSCDGALTVRDLDVFWVDVGEDEAATLAVGGAGVYGCVYTHDLDDGACTIGSLSADGFATLDGEGAGRPLLLFVSSESGAGGSYQLHVTLAARQNDCSSGGDAGGHLRAFPVPVPTTCTGRLGPGDAMDAFSSHLQAGDVLDVTIDTGMSATITVCALQAVCKQFGPSERPIIFHARAASPGSAVASIRTFDASGRGEYAIQLAHHVAAPQDDCETGADAQGVPVWLPDDLACDGILVPEDGDVTDGYRVTARSGPRRVIVTPGDGLGVQLCVGATCAGASSGEPVTVPYASKGGTQSFQITALTGQGAYSVTVLGDDDCGLGNDADLAAELLSTPLTCEGRLTPTASDAADAYDLDMNGTGAWTARVEGADPALRVCASGLNVDEQCASEGEDLLWLALEDSAVVRVEGGTGTYTLVVAPYVTVPV